MKLIVFGFGVLSSTARAICTVPQGKIWTLRVLVLHSTSGASVNVSVNVRQDGASRRMAYAALNANGSLTIEEGWILTEGMAIEALGSTAVNYYACGVESDA